MTDIQIKFWQNYEAHRANLAAEEERHRSARAQEEQKRNELIEANRHNIVAEDISRLQAQISGVHAAAAQRQAAVQERLAELNAMRYGLEKTLNQAQVNKTRAEQARIAAETSLTRSKQYLTEMQTRESQARTEGQLIANYVAEGSKPGKIISAYTDPFSDVINTALNIGKLASFGG